MRKRIVGETPLFLIWSLKQSCALKDEYEVDDLLMLERKFRPLQCLSEASAEKRTIEDTCIDRKPNDSFEPIESVKGFSIDEITSAYGGINFLKKCCDACNANACNFNQTTKQEGNDDKITDGVTVKTKHRYAGCYGYLQSKYESIDLFSQWTESLKLDKSFECFSFNTADRISSLWLDKNLSSDAKKFFEDLINQTPIEFYQLETACQSDAAKLAFNEVMNFRNALIASREFDIELQVQVIPAGIVDKKNWKVPQHCSVCCSNAQLWNGTCPNCQTSLPPNSPLKRFIRGDRPYWPLVRFLGEDGARELISRYRQVGNEVQVD